MIKLEHNWKHKTLENLENEFWGSPTFDSHLVKRTHEIRTLALQDLTNDDVAMMLRQQFSLDYMVPLAIERLQKNILAHGDSGSEGAIMDAVLNIQTNFWKVNKDHWNTIRKLLDDNANSWTFNREQFDEAIPGI